MASLRRLASGNWQVQVRRAGRPAVVKSFKDKNCARQWARLVESEIDRGIFLDRSAAEGTTVRHLIDRYILDVTPTKKSAAKEKQRLNYLKEHFGAFSAARLQARHIAEYRDKRLREGRAGSTVLKELNSLSRVIDTAIKDWGIGLPLNPVQQVRRPAAGRGRDRRLQPGEEDRLLGGCERSKALLLAPAIVVAIETGMRLGELLSLRWKHVSFATKIATLPETKNGNMRRVPLSSRAIEALHAIPRHFSDDRVFWKWRRSDSFEHAWHRAVRKAELLDLRFHDLRHEATSRLFERGFNVMEVSAITGHKTLQMLKRYTHLNVETLVARLG